VASLSVGMMTESMAKAEHRNGPRRFQGPLSSRQSHMGSPSPTYPRRQEAEKRLKVFIHGAEFQLLC